jgi:hypothetical protein
MAQRLEHYSAPEPKTGCRPWWGSKSQFALAPASGPDLLRIVFRGVEFVAELVAVGPVATTAKSGS